MLNRISGYLRYSLFSTIQDFLKTDSTLKQLLGVVANPTYRVDWYRFEEGHEVILACARKTELQIEQTLLSVEIRNNNYVICPWLGLFVTLDFNGSPDPFRQAIGLSEIFQDRCSFGNAFIQETVLGKPDIHLSVPIKRSNLSKQGVKDLLVGIKNEIAQKSILEITQYIEEQKNQQSLVEEMVDYDYSEEE